MITLTALCEAVVPVPETPARIDSPNPTAERFLPARLRSHVVCAFLRTEGVQYNPNIPEIDMKCCIKYVLVRALNIKNSI